MCQRSCPFQGQRIPITEQIVGRLATLIRAPACEVALVRVDGIVGWEFRPGTERVVEPGWAHGSVAVDPAIETRALEHRTEDDNRRRHAGIYSLAAGRDAPYALSLPPDQLDAAELTRLADALGGLSREEIERELSKLPVDWPVTDQELAAVADLVRDEAPSATRRAYREHAVPSNAVRERASVRSGVYEEVFDFAVHNGRAVHLVQCWSFQLPNQADLAEQVKAWSWVVHELRSDGGELPDADRRIDVPTELDIFAIVIAPADGMESPAYEEAKAAFAENQVIELGPDEADRVGEQARLRSG